MDTFAELSPDMIRAFWIIGIASWAVWALYANSIQRLLAKVSEPNRFLKPHQAWLLMIPFFNVYWNFVVVRSVSNSLNNEFFDRKIPEEENPGLKTGLFLSLVFLVAHIPLTPGIILLAMLLFLVYFIMYWVKIVNFRVLLIEHDQFSKKNEIK